MNYLFSLLGHLQVNYRPPSNMGIAIPLTDNFYHADPSKPIPRNLFPKSKVNNFSHLNQYLFEFENSFSEITDGPSCRD